MLYILTASIWIEMQNKPEVSILICGYYREWSNDGLLNSKAQLTATKELTRQMEMADAFKLQIIMLGDANICSQKWKDSAISKIKKYCRTLEI